MTSYFGSCGGKNILLYPPNVLVGLVFANEGSAASCIHHDTEFSLLSGTRSREVLVCNNILPPYNFVHPRGSATVRLLVLFASCGAVSALLS